MGLPRHVSLLLPLLCGLCIECEAHVWLRMWLAGQQQRGRGIHPLVCQDQLRPLSQPAHAQLQRQAGVHTRLCVRACACMYSCTHMSKNQGT